VVVLSPITKDPRNHKGSGAECLVGTSTPVETFLKSTGLEASIYVCRVPFHPEYPSRVVFLGAPRIELSISSFAVLRLIPMITAWQCALHSLERNTLSVVAASNPSFAQSTTRESAHDFSPGELSSSPRPTSKTSYGSTG
jgi:hypothetical protein